MRHQGTGQERPSGTARSHQRKCGDLGGVDRWRSGKPRVQTVARSLSQRDRWMQVQKTVLYRHRPGGVCVRFLLGWCPRRFRRVFADGGRSCRTRGPALGARPHVAAIPAQVEAGAAAIGHHLLSRQADAAYPAPFGVGLFCAVLDPPLPVSDGLLAWESPGTRADLGCASFIWPVGLHVQAPRSVSAHLTYPSGCRRACPSPSRGRAHPSWFPRSHGPDPTLRPDQFPINVQVIYPQLRRVMWTIAVFLFVHRVGMVFSQVMPLA